MVDDDGLAEVVARLAGMVPAGERGSVDVLLERLSRGRLRVLVVGEAKRGKSTFVNALVGRKVLPSGVTPLTAVSTTVVYGDDGAEVVYADGTRTSWPLDELDAVVTERGNPGNRRGVAAVTVRLAAPLLARGVELVDTPGTGSVYAHNTAEAERSLSTADAAVFVVTVDPPMSASERELLARVRAASVATFVALNKVDRLDEAEMAEALTFTRETVTGKPDGTAPPVALGNGDPGTDGAPPVFPVSARRALDGGDPGFDEFAAAFEAYLDRRRETDLRRSVRRHARDVALGLLDEVRVTRRAAGARAGEAARRVEEFRVRLAAVGERRRDAGDLAEGEGRRILAELNEAAAAAGRTLPRRVRDELRAYLTELPGGAPATEIIRTGRDRLADLVRDAVEQWRYERATALEKALAELDDRLLAGLRDELAALRDTARTTLGLELAVPDSGERLVTGRAFFYSFTENVDQLELLAGAVRRRLPGEFGRRWAREHVLGGVPDLVDRQLGRARADLQSRLADSVRGMVRAVDDRYAAGTVRLRAALETADHYRQEDTTDRRDHEARLADRESRLGELLAELTESDQATPVTSAGEPQWTR